MYPIYYNTDFGKSKRKRRRIIFGIIILIFCMIIGYGSFYFYQLHSLSRKISSSPKDNQSLLKATYEIIIPESQDKVSSLKERINVLLLGMAGEGKPGQFLTDTIILASLNTKTSQVAFISIPRDLFVNIPEKNISTKINSVFSYEINDSGSKEKAAELVMQTIESITSLDMDYYVTLNFEGFEKAVDAIGGINIINERDILDTRYPGPNYSYETFELAKGFHHLDGQTALKYARERHNDPNGDFGRAKRQQDIIQAVKNKLFSAETLLNVFTVNKLFNILGENVSTNVSPDEFETFFTLSKKINIAGATNVVLDAWNKDSLLKVSHVYYEDTRAFVLIPRTENWSEIQELSQNIFDLNKIKRNKEEITREAARVLIINKSGQQDLNQNINNLLAKKLGYSVLIGPSQSTKEEKTIIYDLTDADKPFTLNDLATKLETRVSYEPTNAIKKIAASYKADIVIQLGKDLIGKYNGEEGSMEDLDRDNQEF